LVLSLKKLAGGKIMNKIITLTITALAIFNSCSPPSTDNVTISNDYTLYYDYYAFSIGSTWYDVYWPELKITNSSNADSTISFRYWFTVCGVRQTSAGLNRTVNYFAKKGTSYWEMNLDNSMTINSNYACGGNLVDASDVDFYWSVLSVT
jgi:hypothetical protein